MARIDIFNADEVMTLEQVAVQLKVCTQTVRRWQRAGLHTVKCGDRTVTNMASVNEYLNINKPAENKSVAGITQMLNS